MTGLDRRAFLAAGAVAGVGGVAGTAGAAAATPRAKRRPGPPLGAGGRPMTLGELARLARETGGGSPRLFLDLAALDQNAKVLVDFARAHGWAVRPALKSFRSPQLVAYVLQRLPEPRGLVFSLDEVDELVKRTPPGTDLMLGYPPTVGELAGFLERPRPRGQRRHTLRLLVDSVPLMEELGRLARSTRRRVPLDVALEFDVGLGKGGIGSRDELRGCVDVLRASAGRLRLGAVLGYDGHATLNGNAAYRKLVATQAQAAYREHLAHLRELAGGLYDPASLIRNGPASSNYRNWPGGPANEISPGSAFLFAAYLNDFDNVGLAPALTAAGAVRRITSDHPSVPALGTTLPGSREMEVVVQAVAETSELVWPPGAREDELSGGGDALVVPKGSVALGDYVLYRAVQAEVVIQRFAALTALREGRVLRRWPILARPG
jgi:D-serine deaminase-like pyridoxal phosphate-dependent protein